MEIRVGAPGAPGVAEGMARRVACGTRAARARPGRGAHMFCAITFHFGPSMRTPAIIMLSSARVHTGFCTADVPSAADAPERLVLGPPSSTWQRWLRLGWPAGFQGRAETCGRREARAQRVEEAEAVHR